MWKLLLLAVVIESNSSWTTENTMTMVEQANRILAQCQIAVALQQQAVMYPGTFTMDYDSTGVANGFYNQLKIPVLFLVEARQYNGSAGWTPGNKFLFISSYSRSEDYKKLRNPGYEILAHELGHMLGDLPHLASEQNLMAGYIANQTAQLTQEQCRRMRSSVHLSDGNLY